MDEIADYRLTESLGEGNHGQFFLAAPPSRLGEGSDYVAVKVLAAPSTDDAVGIRPAQKRVVMPTIGWLRVWAPVEPMNGASPKLKMPPSEATSQ